MSFSGHLYQTLLKEHEHECPDENFMLVPAPPITVIRNASMIMLACGLLAITQTDTEVWLLNTNPARSGTGDLPEKPSHLL